MVTEGIAYEKSLTSECLPENFPDRPHAKSAKSESFGILNLARLIDDLLEAGEPEIYRKLTLAVDRIVLDVILRHTKGNQVQASELLGISRTTLRAKLRSCGLGVEKQLLSDPDI